MRLIKTCLFWLVQWSIHPLLAQEEAKTVRYAIGNTTELQYSLSEKPKAKGVNLLSLQAAVPTDRYWKNGSFECAVWGVLETHRHVIAADELTFSNIEAGNRLICSKLGYAHTWGKLTLFAGIRNVNTDYFNTPYSAVFMNSSAGIYPTISLNYGVANYPFGACGLHAEYNAPTIQLKSSFYNNIQGLNERLFFKFHFNPKRYGYTHFSQIMHTSASGYYIGGLVLEKRPQNKIRQSVYGLIEQRMLQIDHTSIGLIGQAGYAPKKENACYAYKGIGTLISGIFNTKNPDIVGLILFQANIKEGSETAIELTYQYKINPLLSVQSSLHSIHNNRGTIHTGVLRAIVTLGN